MVGDGNHGLADAIWSVADLLRSQIRTSEYGSVILPFTVLRRVDCLRQQGTTPRPIDEGATSCQDGPGDSSAVGLRPRRWCTSLTWSEGVAS
ncbi:type I restriction-modification system subunit M N-terminal domain-containing protein [Spirillospora sp. NPDC048819]|uniref:type I restriction-modification system subunit M N-terminal domain-containing protein n=1 Tax=Spirillospora sp. NPDC048819 TaxID=3155268 RepID=UPI0033D24EB8